MTSEDKVTIEQLIKFFNSTSTLKKTKKKLLRESIKTFRQCAQVNGLTNEQVLSVANLASSQKFDEQNSSLLIYSLLPRESISEDTILMVISKICSDAQSLKIKCLLIRWIILVFDFIAVKTRLHLVYGLLFHYIQNDTLCPHICHLLYLLTRKSDVTHYRIQRLLELQRKIGTQPHLSGLLSLYRMYHPSLISMAGFYKKFFKTDKAWEKTLASVQQKYGLSLFNEAVSFRIYSGHKNSTRPKTDSLIHPPTVSMVHDDDTEQPLAGVVLGKTPIHQIKSFQELVNSVAQLSVTSQAHTMLSSRTLQHLMAITPDRTVALRLSFWLHDNLSNELLCSDGESEKGEELLAATVQFSSLIQECVPVCEEFLFRYLWTWNGLDYRKYILNMISKLRIMPFEELRAKVLMPLRKLFFLSPRVYFKCSVINTLSDLLTNYLSLECDRYLNASEDPDAYNLIRFTAYCHGSSSEIDIDSTLSQLIHFVDDLFAKSVRTVDNGDFLLFYVLQFHLQVSNIYFVHKRPFVVLPSNQTFFRSFFSLSAPCLALMLRILCNHFKTVTALRENEKSVLVTSDNTTELLNRYCLDVYDAIWRRRAFRPQCQEKTILFCDVHEDSFEQFLSHSRDLPASRAFSVDRHPSLIAYTKEYLTVYEKPFSDVDEAEFVLDSSFALFLETKGLKDVIDFVQLLQTS